jgi:hypothetical protein
VALELLERTSLTVTQLTLLNGSIWLEHYRPLLTQRLLLHALTGPLISRLRLIGYRAFARQFGSVFATPPPGDRSVLAASGASGRTGGWTRSPGIRRRFRSSGVSSIRWRGPRSPKR